MSIRNKTGSYMYSVNNRYINNGSGGAGSTYVSNSLYRGQRIHYPTQKGQEIEGGFVLFLSKELASELCRVSI